MAPFEGLEEVKKGKYPVTRTVEGRCGACHCGVDVKATGAEVADSGGRTVELVLCVEDEEDVEGVDQPWVGDVLLLVHAVQHVEEVL